MVHARRRRPAQGCANDGSTSQATMTAFRVQPELQRPLGGSPEQRCPWFGVTRFKGLSLATCGALLPRIKGRDAGLVEINRVAGNDR
jgi:hypothetical protein